MLQIPGRALGLRGQILGLGELQPISPAWDDLCRRCVEDNVYYAPRYALALLENVERNTNIAFAVVWEGPRLVALLPFTRRRVRVPLFQPSGQAWCSKYTFSCMPVLDKEYATEAASALLDVLISVNSGEWVIPVVNADGPACRAVTTALAARLLPWTLTGRFQRAVLMQRGTFEEHMALHVSAKRRKDIARNRRRLERVGRVEHESFTGGEGLRRAVSAFLDIEAKGWKGKRGTALGCGEPTRQFAVDAFNCDDGVASACRADVLTLDGTPIAVSLIVTLGSTGFTVKCTYDEAYRSFSAGLLLEIEVMRAFLSGNWATQLDSATAGSHVIDGLWGDHIEVADLMFSLAPSAPELRFGAFRFADRLRRETRNKLKSWLA
jgi:CelD/BcsL family acetyltransferase involved in cellulose biosynthesis